MISVSPWSGLVLIELIAEGNRNEVWRGELANVPVAVRQSRRGPESLAWELDLIEYLDRAGFSVPAVISADDGRRSVDGVVVQRWLEGDEPATASDWHRVSAELIRLHDATAGYAQRPGCATVLELPSVRRSGDADLDLMPPEIVARVVAVFAGFVDVPIAVIHGDPTPDNIRLGPDGSVGLVDWDESRVDLIWHDLSNLGLQILDDASHARALQLSNAWEAANGWIVEPAYARRRLAMLGD